MRKPYRGQTKTKRPPLPKELSFLKGVRFHSVGTIRTDGRKTVLVRFLPATIKKILSRAAKGLDEVNSLSEKVEILTAQNEEMKNKIRDLESANEQMRRNIVRQNDRGRVSGVDGQKSPTNAFDIAERRGIDPKGPTYSGGLPSLGKRG